ncbi:MAG: aspartate-semialdehyde dehydrogenase [Candidatus Omnitrophota bacterium]
MRRAVKKQNVAIVGATGAVGGCFLRLLEERRFPVRTLRLLASERSRGKKLRFKGRYQKVEALGHDSFEDIDIVLSSAGAERSLEFLPSAVKSGAVCVDNTSAFRMRDDIPLVVPEVNARRIRENRGIIANPNCSTIQMVVALWPIHKAAGIKRIVVTTYQSVSGAGQKKVAELLEQSKRFLAKKRIVPKEFPHPIAFNLIPQIDVFLKNGYTKEEMKMVNETKKIMEDDSIKVNATCVRVPVLYAHSESVCVELKRRLSAGSVRKILRASPGVTVVDEPSRQRYPMPLDAQGRDDVFVGRIREDDSVANGIAMWVVSDNLRKGAALNAIQIAERLIR